MARIFWAPLMSLLLLPLVAGACGYTATCTYENRTNLRVNVFEALAGDDGKPTRPPGLVRELGPMQTAQGACGVTAGESDYRTYFEARAFSQPQNKPITDGSDVIWSETIGRKELEKRGKWVVIETGSSSQLSTTPNR